MRDMRLDREMRQPPSHRPMLVLALAVSIPAFYLILTGKDETQRWIGSLLYLGCAVLAAFDILRRRTTPERRPFVPAGAYVDTAICLGAVASSWLTVPPWSLFEWSLRLLYCAIVFLRLSTLVIRWFAPRHLIQILGSGALLLAISGAGFYWLEPRVHTYADGLWLAFITAATVGYGDLVPSTPASRIFAVFIVLLGYAVFSVVTASIAALFVGEDEKRFEKELHADIRALRKEIVALHAELYRADGTAAKRSFTKSDHGPGDNPASHP